MHTSIAEAPDKGIPHDHVVEPIIRIQVIKSQRQMDLETLGRHIKKRWLASGFTIQQLVKKTGLSKRTLERVMSGSVEPSYRTLDRITWALRFTITIGGNRNSAKHS